jgi:hypothetical protein
VGGVLHYDRRSVAHEGGATVTTDVDEILKAVRSLPREKQLEVLQNLARSLSGSWSPLAEASAEFWSGRSIEDLAAEQGARPVSNLDDLVMAAWPEDEMADDIISYIRSQREADRGT